MCYAIEYLVNEASEKASILTLIDGYRDIDMPESEIEERVMKKFNLSKEKVKDYMVVKSA